MSFDSAQDKVPFWFSYILMKFWNILKYGMNSKSETIVQIFRKIIQLNTVYILKITNEYYQKMICKKSFKMDFYPATRFFVYDRDIDLMVLLHSSLVPYI